MPDQPNFLIIMPDQQRGDCLSIAGHPALLTPNMDALAWRGSRFSRAYSTCPSCIPARRAFMSGLYPASNGMVGYREGVPWKPATTLPAELRRHGYQTALVGRTMHLCPVGEPFGFEHLAQQDRREGMEDDYERFLRQRYGDPMDVDYRQFGFAGSHGISANGWTARPWHLDEAAHPTTWTVSQSVRFLRQRDRSRPFFLVSSFIAPHPPLVPPPFYMERYLRLDLPQPALGDWAEPPPNGGLGQPIDSDRCVLGGEMLRSCLAGYYGLINHLDDQMFRLGEALAQTGAGHNTVVIFTSDHGEMLGDHYLFRKTYPFEGSARIPLLVAGPPDLGLARQQVRDEVVCLEDLMPTVLDLAGCPIPQGLDGRSLVPLLRGGPGAAEGWRPYLHGEHAVCYRKEQANHYLTDGREKYVWFTQQGTEMLFDLGQDPRELRNLAARPEHAGRVAQWRERLVQRLQDRPEGFSDGRRLIPGRPYDACLPHVHGPGA